MEGTAKAKQGFSNGYQSVGAEDSSLLVTLVLKASFILIHIHTHLQLDYYDK